MTVTDIIKRIEDGEPFRVSFEKRTLTLNGSLIKDIEFESKEKLLDYYRLYKTSVPSTKSDSKYFIALDETQLTTKQLVENESRYVARARLELLVLGMIVNGTWEYGDKWYWQSVEEPKLVLFRKWFETKGEF